MPSAYLDHAASTPMRPEALAAMVEVLERAPGNPSGQHRWAREARRLLDDARDRIAAVVGAHPRDVVLTSGGTEADNLAITGTVAAMGGRPLCLVTDHHAALAPVRAAGGRTIEVGQADGTVTDEAVVAALRATPDASVVSMALANNELGVIQPVAELVAVIAETAPGAVVHLDAVAAAAWVDLAAASVDASLVSLSGHKVGGPKGVGALVVRPGVALRPQLVGGSQELERRAGTPDVAGAVAFAVALERSAADRVERCARVAAQRDRLESALLAAGDDLVRTTSTGDAERLSNIAHLSARGVHREALLFRLDAEGVAASSGSSCASGATERSHVIAALGLPAELEDGALRLSLGWCTTDEEIDHAIDVVSRVVRELRGTVAEPSR